VSSDGPTKQEEADNRSHRSPLPLRSGVGNCSRELPRKRLIPIPAELCATAATAAGPADAGRRTKSRAASSAPEARAARPCPPSPLRALTASGLGQTMFGLASGDTFKARQRWRAFSLHRPHRCGEAGAEAFDVPPRTSSLGLSRAPSYPGPSPVRFRDSVEGRSCVRHTPMPRPPPSTLGVGEPSSS
jgi:hypothetical protein